MEYITSDLDSRTSMIENRSVEMTTGGNIEVTHYGNSPDTKAQLISLPERNAIDRRSKGKEC